jgi:integrase/recombinase XerD
MPREKQYENAAERQRAYRARKGESVHFRSRADQWATPPDLFDELNEEFAFTLDVCAEKSNAKCKKFFSPKEDGLKQRWEGTCWMNPPYGRGVSNWMRKARQSAEENGATVVCLVPARTDTAWWHEEVAPYIGERVEARFLKGRLKFGGQENSAPFPSVIVVFHGNPLKKQGVARKVSVVENSKEVMGAEKNAESDNEEIVRENSGALVIVGQELMPVGQGDTRQVATSREKKAFSLSPLVSRRGEHAERRFLEFFAVTIRNIHTRKAYIRAVSNLLDFCEEHGVIDITQIQPMMVAGYIEKRCQEKAKPTVKQELAAIRQMFDYLVTGHIVEVNPALSVKGPRYSIQVGKTPVLTREEARKLLDGIPVTYTVKKGDVETEHPDILGLRDRAFIGLMVFSFARVGAVTKMKVSDYYTSGKKWKARLHEKGGKSHELPVHHKAEEYLDAYLELAGIREDKKTPLFRTRPRRGRNLSERGMTPSDALYMIKRRALEAGLPTTTCCHTFRATGITAYLEGGGTVENAQAIANHADSRTTKLYDRRGEKISLDEIEKIQL